MDHLKASAARLDTARAELAQQNPPSPDTLQRLAAALLDTVGLILSELGALTKDRQAELAGEIEANREALELLAQETDKAGQEARAVRAELEDVQRAAQAAKGPQ